MSWTTKQLSFDSRKEKEVLPSPKHPGRPWVHLASYSVSTRGFLSRVKRPWPEVDRSFLSIAAVKNVWIFDVRSSVCVHSLLRKRGSDVLFKDIVTC